MPRAGDWRPDGGADAELRVDSNDEPCDDDDAGQLVDWLDEPCGGDDAGQPDADWPDGDDAAEQPGGSCVAPDGGDDAWDSSAEPRGDGDDAQGCWRVAHCCDDDGDESSCCSPSWQSGGSYAVGNDESPEWNHSRYVEIDVHAGALRQASRGYAERRACACLPSWNRHRATRAGTRRRWRLTRPHAGTHPDAGR